MKILFALPVAFVIACGGGRTTKAPVTAAPRDAGAGAAVAAATLSPPPTGLPPMATMPPPGVAGSKKAKRRVDAALAACSASARPHVKDVADQVKKIGESCAGASKMKPAATLMRGQQGDREPHQENRFRAEGNHCYRVYFAGDEAVKDVLIVLRDSSGDIIAEAPGPAVPDDGAACFTTTDEVTVLVAVGGGKGAWAAQVWGD